MMLYDAKSVSVEFQLMNDVLPLRHRGNHLRELWCDIRGRLVFRLVSGLGVCGRIQHFQHPVRLLLHAGEQIGSVEAVALELEFQGAFREILAPVFLHRFPSSLIPNRYRASTVVALGDRVVFQVS